MTRFVRCMFLSGLLAGLFFAGASTALAQGDDSPQALAKFFQSQTKSLPSPGIDFQVTAGFAVLSTGNPDSSGRYAMTASNITRVATNIYRLDLQLEKPQPRAIDSLE